MTQSWQSPIPVISSVWRSFFEQRKALNDPFTGGLSSYGLVLMVAFALLRRDTLSTTTSARANDRELDGGPLPPMGRADSPRKNDCGHGCACEDAPPSPCQGHTPCSPPSLAKQTKYFGGKAGRTIGLSSLGRQRGFWQRSSLSENRSTAMAMLAAHTHKIVGTGEGRPSAARGRNTFNVDVFWDRCVSLTATIAGRRHYQVWELKNQFKESYLNLLYMLPQAPTAVLVRIKDGTRYSVARLLRWYACTGTRHRGQG